MSIFDRELEQLYLETVDVENDFGNFLIKYLSQGTEIAVIASAITSFLVKHGKNNSSDVRIIHYATSRALEKLKLKPYDLHKEP